MDTTDRVHSQDNSPQGEVFSPLPILLTPSRDPGAAGGNWIPDLVGDERLERPSCARPFAGMQAMEPTRSTVAIAQVHSPAGYARHPLEEAHPTASGGGSYPAQP